MEAGHGAAGDGDEEEGEQGLPVDREAGEGGQVDVGPGGEDADDGGHDHGHQQVAVQVIPGLEQGPDGGHRGDEHIDEHQDVPGPQAQIEREGEPQGDGGHQHDEGDGGVGPLVELSVAEQEAQGHGLHDEDHGGGGHRSVGGDGGQGPVRRRLEAVEGAGHDVHEGGHHQDGEEPAEEQEELLTRLADVGLDDIADGVVEELRLSHLGRRHHDDAVHPGVGKSVHRLPEVRGAVGAPGAGLGAGLGGQAAVFLRPFRHGQVVRRFHAGQDFRDDGIQPLYPLAGLFLLNEPARFLIRHRHHARCQLPRPSAPGRAPRISLGHSGSWRAPAWPC